MREKDHVSCLKFIFSVGLHGGLFYTSELMHSLCSYHYFYMSYFQAASIVPNAMTANLCLIRK